MQRLSRQDSQTLEPSEILLLVTAQIEQPVKKGVIRKLFENSPYFGLVSESDFNRAFNKLECAQYLWRTADNSYVVTPKAEPLIRTALKHKQRDKIRLLMLNKRRYK
jgi:hypothetical protein